MASPGCSAAAVSATRAIWGPLLRGVVLALSFVGAPALAYEHHHSRVAFQEYADDVIERNLAERQPYFLLFSAEWCHWCHEFAEHALAREEVYTFLNRHFINVFIDADIHTAAYARYRATGLPYIVFLNPDGSVHFKYSGTIYGDEFIEVLRDLKLTIEQKIVIPGQAVELEPYVPPSALSVSDLVEVAERFREGILESFDPTEHGVGRGEKAILPRTFLHLLKQANDDRADGLDREAVVESVEMTLSRAVDAIYDPVEGGFFRYAETRDWQVPHYEKMADLNAGAALVLYRLGEMSPSSPELMRAAGTRTIEYLSSTLYEPRLGTFLSFQGADTRYFLLDAAMRSAARSPAVADKVLIDRLAATLDHLIDVLPYAADPALERRVLSSLDFLASMTEEQGHLRRYHHLADGAWQGDALPRDHALVAHVLQKAARHFSEPRYARSAHKVVEAAVSRFYDARKGIFVAPGLADGDSVEYLMEVNALLGLAMMRLHEDGYPQRWDVVESLMTYFSGVGALLDERLWESRDWEVMETYVPYLDAIDLFLAAGG